MKKGILILSLMATVSVIHTAIPQRTPMFLNLSTKASIYITERSIGSGKTLADGDIEASYGPIIVIKPGKNAELEGSRFQITAKLPNGRPVGQRIFVTMENTNVMPVVAVDVGYMSGGSMHLSETITAEQLSYQDAMRKYPAQYLSQGE